MSTTGQDNRSPTDSAPEIEALIKAYCPPLEAGLVYALASDFDLDDTNSLSQLKSTLNELKESAEVEQELELLPQHDERVSDVAACGTDSRRPDHEIDSSQLSESNRMSATDADGVTSITTAISGLRTSDIDGSESGHGSGYGETTVEFASLSEKDKRKMLSNMFPNVSAQDVDDVLARCKGQFDSSTDELLNLSFLGQDGEAHGDQSYEVPKGVDGFLSDGADASRRKTKAKGSRNKHRTDHKSPTDPWASDSAMSSGSATPNIWRNLPEDVGFITSRTQLKPKLVTSVYHANGAHLAPTIRALAIKEGEMYHKTSHSVDEIMEWQLDELRVDYNHIPDAQLYGILTMANNMPNIAKELLDAMLNSNEQPVILGKVTGLASYTPIDLSDDEPTIKKAVRNSMPLGVPAASGVYTTSHLSNAQGLAAGQAFQQATSAYRRGKSDHLMGGAAAYYASVGHERIKAAKAVQALAADAHVAAQSSSAVLDLHGVNVSDAVRIAQTGTVTWWEGLGDRKYVVGGRGDGYRIVTGVGRHSADGIGRIGPAVSKSLVRDGWRVEVGRGEIIVSGRARR